LLYNALMDELAKEYVVSFFERTLMLHGDRPEAVRWTAPGQREHYRAALDIGDLRGRSLLDYGCGTGGFYGFLRSEGINVSYRGCDINPHLIEHAKKKYPGAGFAVFDIEEELLDEEFDYILLCGVFNLKVQGIDDTIRNVLRKLFARCRIGLGFNALSDHIPRKDYELNYSNPESMLCFALDELSPHAAIRHDRIPFDYWLFVYRTARSFEEGIASS